MALNEAVLTDWR